MSDRPEFLSPENAARFQAPEVVDVYHHRLPYPPETFEILASLLPAAPRTLLDVGTGPGNIARGMLPYVDRVDAVDISAAMIARGKQMPGGDDPKLRWILDSAETAPLNPPYGLITAGESIHWMDWEPLFARFAEVLAPEGCVVLMGREAPPPPWHEGLRVLTRAYSTMGQWVEFDIIEELKNRGLFAPEKRVVTQPVPFRQQVEDLIAREHSRSSLSLAAMPPADAQAFDAKLRSLLTPYAQDGWLDLQTGAWLCYGKPR